MTATVRTARSVLGLGLLAIVLVIAIALPSHAVGKSGADDSQADAIALAASAAREAISATSADVPSSEAQTWETDLDCAACHVAEVESSSASDASGSKVTGAEGSVADVAVGSDDEGASHVGLMATHAGFGFECLDCHNQGDVLEAMHAKAASKKIMPKRLKKTEVGSELCLGCHDAESLAEATRDLDLLTDEVGTTVNPHDLPQTDEQVHEQIVCVDCHTFHGDESDLETSARNYCLSCHHANVYECYTCHGPK